MLKKNVIKYGQKGGGGVETGEGGVGGEGDRRGREGERWRERWRQKRSEGDRVSILQ